MVNRFLYRTVTPIFVMKLKNDNDMTNGMKNAEAKGKPYYYGVAGTTRPINRPK